MKRHLFIKFLCIVLTVSIAVLSFSSCSLEELAENIIDELNSAESTPEESVSTTVGTTQTTTAQQTEETTAETEETTSAAEQITWEDTYVPSYGDTVYISRRESAEPDEYYWRSTLTGEQRKAYDEIVAGTSQYLTKIKISAAVSFSESEIVYRAFTLDHPEVFWYGNGFFATGPEKNIDDINLSLVFDVSEIPSLKQKVEAAARQIVDAIPDGTSDIEAELALYKYLTSNLEYDLKAENAYSLYGALIGKRCVCQGFAEAFQYMCNMLGIPCISIVGMATNGRGETEAHKWNAVKIGGKWYPVDATFGEGSAVGFPLYFNNAAKIETNHTPYQNLIGVPEFYDDDAEYLNYFGLTYNADDFYDVFMRATHHFSENRSKNSVIAYVVLRAKDQIEENKIKRLLDENEGEYLDEIIGDYNEVFDDSLVYWNYEFKDGLLIVQIFRL
ncbi:MAG: hypothetical protein J5832_00575 [Clostridia bacterium]|nr:hypothetical protein [Clostridia bacterium]